MTIGMGHVQGSQLMKRSGCQGTAQEGIRINQGAGVSRNRHPHSCVFRLPKIGILFRPHSIPK
jgi:hypothetical protein